MERLQKIIARAGLASRREAERWIVEGRVSVNGTVVRKLGSQAEPSSDSIKVDGKRIKPVLAKLYYALHKPPGVITTLNDPENRPDLTPYLAVLGEKRRVFPVGRLDYNTTGLLLLTNDGDLALRPWCHCCKWLAVARTATHDIYFNFRGLSPDFVQIGHPGSYHVPDELVARWNAVVVEPRQSWGRQRRPEAVRVPTVSAGAGSKSE